ncbi:UNVERIFIED_ORG: pyrroline-5-carboxylate reductase [Ensifer adhaerens]|nr:pyrroline-5-carboxylate reductase [Ensifer adhaerens]
MLSVRPQDLDAIALDLSGKLVISVMAMVSLADLAARFEARRIIRAMPNTAAEKRLSFTPWLASPDTTEADCAFAERLFEASGKVQRIATETELDYFTALTGSGPAFLAVFADAMISDAVTKGIERGIAERAVRQLFLGGSTLLAGSKQTPDEIVQTFLDYAGTTAAGLEAMAAADIHTPIARGLTAAAAKAAAVNPRLRPRVGFCRGACLVQPQRLPGLVSEGGTLFFTHGPGEREAPVAPAGSARR